MHSRHCDKSKRDAAPSNFEPRSSKSAGYHEEHGSSVFVSSESVVYDEEHRSSEIVCLRSIEFPKYELPFESKIANSVPNSHGFSATRTAQD
jgi:hypothetical protein